MKKTFSINISGTFFHIDEDAYSQLDTYIKNIKIHFQHHESNDDIVSDIESRIAEILLSKITQSKEVITLDDVKDVMERMGQPSEFSDEEQDDSLRNQSSIKYKRLYRDPNNKFIGGVASGIAAYFNMNPIWIRIIFAISIFSMIGPFIYFILWIAIPEARSASERLEMQGQNVTISNIEHNIKKEIDHLKKRFNDVTDQAKKTYKEQSPHAKTVFDNLWNACIILIKLLGKGLIILFGFIILCIGFSIMLVLLGTIFGFNIFDSFYYHGSTIIITDFINIIIGSSGNIGLFKVGLFFLLIIPLLMLIYHGLRLMIGFERIQGMGTTAFLLWLIGILFTLYFSFNILKNFKYEVTNEKELAIEQPPDDFIYLNLKELMGSNYVNYNRLINLEELEFVIGDENYFINDIHMKITKSKSGNFELFFFASSHGRNLNEAQLKAESISYYFEQKDNIFNFDNFYSIPKEIPWSLQEVLLEFKIPVGTKIKLDRNIRKLFTNKRNYYYSFWHDETYIMTEDGLEVFRTTNTP